MIHPASVCSRMYALQHIPLEIVSDDGHFIQCWPESFMNIMKPEIFQLVVRDFRMQNHDSFGMEDLSAYCGLCRRSLSLRFKTEVGMSVLDYIQKEKHDEACFLLEHTDLTLTQISNYLNYSSQSYFTQQFKKSAGVTPERYRRQHPKRDDSH